MVGPDEYPVYNHRERPGIGRDHLGHTHYNCFSIFLKRDESGRYLPYLFSDFIKQYNNYTGYSGTCDSCISEHKMLTFRADHAEVDRSAVEKKFSQDENLDESFYHYCPLIHEVLLTSELHAETVYESSQDLPAEPFQAILDGNWDDDYLFEFHKIGVPQRMKICPICRETISSQFASTPAERSFLTMWVLSMFQYMEIVRQSGQKTYLEDLDFDQFQSKIFSFVFPVPQVWVYVISKPPPGVDWQKWDQQHQAKTLPQRVDFLFTYRKTRHIIELDDIRHYGAKSAGTWVASEAQYRQTLLDSRWLRGCGFEVHRFTNEEILELYKPDSSKKPNIEGFIRLLRLEGLEPEDMVFLKTE